MFFGGIDGSMPLTERVIPGSGEKGATLIQPFPLFEQMFTGLMKSWEKEISELSLPEQSVGYMYFSECKENLEDLLEEYRQYTNAVRGEEDQDEDEE